MSPRRAATIRWTLAAATAVFFAVWLTSGWLRASVATTNMDIWEVADGSIWHHHFGSPLLPDEMKFQVRSNHRFVLLWKSREVWGSGRDWRGRAYPLWPVATVILAANILWLLHLRATRRTDRCQNCHYPRTGLTPTSPCPECGTARAPESAL